nr:hypothetical protein [Nanoarchaeum sp.]
MVKELVELLPAEDLRGIDGRRLVEYLRSTTSSELISANMCTGCVACNSGGGCTGPSGVMNYGRYKTK